MVSKSYLCLRVHKRLAMNELIHEKQRRECWTAAYAAVASAYNCPTHEVALKWADNALKAFDERFKANDFNKADK